MKILGSVTDSLKSEHCGILLEKSTKRKFQHRNLALTCLVLIESLLDVGR